MRTWRLIMAMFCGLLMAAALLAMLNPETLVKARSPAAMFWKAGGWNDYAPNGVPDFDQKQACWGQPFPCNPGAPPLNHTYCGPVAAANSLWWFDSKFEPYPIMPPTPNDNYFLINTYPIWQTMGFMLDDHDPLNVGGMTAPGVGNPGVVSPPSLVDELAWYFDTDRIRTHLGGGTGTNVRDLSEGLQWWLYGGNPAWGDWIHGPRPGSYYDDYHVQMVKAPPWNWLVYEVEHSEDVVLLLGFWVDNGLPGYPNFERVGGHFVTVAGIESGIQQIAFSDPYHDNEELVPGAGRVLTGTIYTPHTPGHPTWTHNDAGNVSHDAYLVNISPQPHWTFEIVNYPYNTNFQAQNANPDVLLNGIDPGMLQVRTFVEYAVAVSPFTWKPGGEWVYQYYNEEWIWEWWSHKDDADSCMPDFLWSDGLGSSNRVYDGATALADSLWWFDSKAETLLTGGFPIEPSIAITDHYPLVTSYSSGVWDDHDSSNSVPLINDLATYLNTGDEGTTTDDMAAGVQEYLEATLTDGDFYTKTRESPSFDWVADEVIACEDVVMLLGFYENIEGDWERKGGHWVDAAGVNKDNDLIGLSDPWIDGSNVQSFFDIEHPGRIFPPERLLDEFSFSEEEKRNPQNISHDIYLAGDTDVDSYEWELDNYPVDDVVYQAIGLNGGGVSVVNGSNDLATVVEWAIGISPYSDLVITKTASVTELFETGPITYVIEYANTGLAAVSNVTISETLPITALTNLAYTAEPPLTATVGITYSWSIPKLSYGQSGVITITADIIESYIPGIYTNKVRISNPTSERSSSDNQDQTTFQVGYFIYLSTNHKEIVAKELLAAGASIIQSYDTNRITYHSEMSGRYRFFRDYLDNASYSPIRFENTNQSSSS